MNSMPAVPKWGGTSAYGHTLSNTYTIDNFLTIVHLTARERPRWVDNLRSETKSRILSTLSNCILLMDEGNFTDAKLAWSTVIKDIELDRQYINMFGDEYDMFVGQIISLLIYRESRVCSCSCCLNPYKEKESKGIFLRYILMI